MRWEKFAFQSIKVYDDGPIVKLMVAIDSYRQSVLRLPVPPGLGEKIDRINIIRQIRGTTALEGNTLTEAKIGAVIDDLGEEKQDGDISKDRNREEREIENAFKSQELIKSEILTNPNAIISEELIKKLHYCITDGIEYEHNTPGVYRNFQNRVSDFMPPRHEEVPALMEEFIQFINSREMIDGCKPLIRSIIAHFYLVTIHPFGDGNGRTSRDIEAFILYAGGYNVLGFHSLANFYYQNRSKYIEELQAARFIHNGNLRKFVEFSLDGYLQELKEVQQLIIDFYTELAYKDYLAELATKKIINTRVEAMLRFLCDTGLNLKVGPDELENKKNFVLQNLYRGKSYKTLKRDLNDILNLRIGRIVNGQLAINKDIMSEFYKKGPLGSL